MIRGSLLFILTSIFGDLLWAYGAFAGELRVPVCHARAAQFSLTQPRVSVHSDSLLPKSVLHNIHSVLASAADEFSKAFEIHHSPRVSLQVLAPVQFHQLLDAPGWVGAMYYGGKILIPYTREIFQRPALKMTLRHEYAHAAIAEASACRCPAWLDEGIAQLFEGREMRPADLKGLQKLIGRHPRALSLKSLERGFTRLPQGRAYEAYQLSLYAAGHLMRRASPKEMRSFLLNLSTSGSVETAFQSAFSMSLDEFDGKLRTEILRQG